MRPSKNIIQFIEKEMNKGPLKGFIESVLMDWEEISSTFPFEITTIDENDILFCAFIAGVLVPLMPSSHFFSFFKEE